MHRYLIVIEPSETGYAAFSPDVPGCIATAATRTEVEGRMQEALAFHLEGLRAEGLPLPTASADASWVEVAA
jgi:predicted RNase H-like HicB family nuclease